MIVAFSAKQTPPIGQHIWIPFYERLYTLLSKYTDELKVGKVSRACQRLWSSDEKMEGVTFYFMVNQLLRDDVSGEDMKAVAVFCRGVNSLIVNRNPSAQTPPPPLPSILYRGASLPPEHQPFFSVGKVYRCPMFLATSPQYHVASSFFGGKTHPVLYVINVTVVKNCQCPQYVRCSHGQPTCSHVAFLQHTEYHGEDEYLFVPYSVFTVKSVTWKSPPTSNEPHVIELDAAIDNVKESDVLDLAPYH